MINKRKWFYCFKFSDTEDLDMLIVLHTCSYHFVLIFSFSSFFSVCLNLLKSIILVPFCCALLHDNIFRKNILMWHNNGDNTIKQQIDSHTGLLNYVPFPILKDTWIAQIIYFWHLRVSQPFTDWSLWHIHTYFSQRSIFASALHLLSISFLVSFVASTVEK